MNLIGPRPHPVSNHATFMEHIAYYGLRSTVRPGVTGWAQVRYGYANNLEEETEKMRYDLYYIKNRSLWLDFADHARDGRHHAVRPGRRRRCGIRRRCGRDLSWPARDRRAKEIAYVPVLADQGTPRPTAGRQ